MGCQFPLESEKAVAELRGVLGGHHRVASEAGGAWGLCDGHVVYRQSDPISCYLAFPGMKSGEEARVSGLRGHSGGAAADLRDRRRVRAGRLRPRRGCDRVALWRRRALRGPHDRAAAAGHGTRGGRRPRPSARQHRGVGHRSHLLQPPPGGVAAGADGGAGARGGQIRSREVAAPFGRPFGFGRLARLEAGRLGRDASGLRGVNGDGELGLPALRSLLRSYSFLSGLDQSTV